MINEIRLSYWEESVTINGVGHCDELIENHEKLEPKKKSTTEYKTWRMDYNRLVDITNKMAGFRRYSLKK